MKVIITESQYKKILLEQSNVYTDNVEYKKALYKYNREMSVYKAFLEVYQKIPSLLDKDPNYELLKGKNDKFKSPTYFNKDKLGKLSSPSIKMIKKIVGYNLEYTIEELIWWYYFIKKIPNTVHFYEPLTNSYRKRVWSVPEFDKSIYEKLGKPKINKWYKVRDTRNNIGGVQHFGDLWIPLFEKPLTQKPILQKTEPPKTTPLPTQPSKAVPPKSVPPPTIQSTLDKTKPVDFYFGNRILRAPDYEIAKKFAEKLALRNFNSNQVFVYKDKNNEKWFIGANDKIYFSQNSYNQDPNKNVYVDPIDVGMVFI